jgi:hypothetical protein
VEFKYINSCCGGDLWTRIFRYCIVRGKRERMIVNLMMGSQVVKEIESERKNYPKQNARTIKNTKRNHQALT